MKEEGASSWQKEQKLSRFKSTGKFQSTRPEWDLNAPNIFLIISLSNSLETRDNESTVFFAAAGGDLLIS